MEMARNQRSSKQEKAGGTDSAGLPKMRFREMGPPRKQWAQAKPAPRDSSDVRKR
jgi:hypothetical protein